MSADRSISMSATRGRPTSAARVYVGAGEETGGKDTMTPIDACGFGPGGDVHTDPKGHKWMMVCTPAGAVGVSPPDEANAELMGKDRADLIEKIDALSTNRGYATLAIIGAGIAVAIWWFFREIKP